MVSIHFFTRHGGVSSGNHMSLNVSFGTGDNPANIEENRARIRRRIGTQRLISAQQLHSSRVYIDDGRISDAHEVEGYDALISNQSATALMIQQADCQAVFLFDPVENVIAAVHSGWRGSVANIIGETIERMSEHFGTDPKKLQGCISPALGPCCAEFVNYQEELPEAFHPYQVKDNYFDFWQISANQLAQSGVMPVSIRKPDICTSCSRDYFSYRRAVREGDPVCGRHASVICLDEHP